MTAIDPRVSPCRAHPCSAEHADVVLEFRATAELWQQQADEQTKGYAEELERYRQEHPPPLFRDWLIHNRRTA